MKPYKINNYKKLIKLVKIEYPLLVPDPTSPWNYYQDYEAFDVHFSNRQVFHFSAFTKSWIKLLGSTNQITPRNQIQTLKHASKTTVNHLREKFSSEEAYKFCRDYGNLIT